MSKPVIIGKLAQRRAMEARAEEVANDLRGTASNLLAFASLAEANNRFFCNELDDQVFECVECGWWCDDEERNDDNVCNDCYRAGDENAEDDSDDV